MAGKEDLLNYEEKTIEELTGLIDMYAHSSHPEEVKRYRSARYWRNVKYGIRVDPGYEWVLTDHTWTLGKLDLYSTVQEGDDWITVSLSRFMHAQYYGRKLHTYARNETPYRLDRDIPNNTSDNIPKYCSQSANQRSKRKNQDKVRGLCLRSDGRYRVSFSIHYKHFHCGYFDADQLSTAIKVAKDCWEKVASVPEVELLQPHQIHKALLAVANPLREEAGLRPVKTKYF